MAVAASSLVTVSICCVLMVMFLTGRVAEGDGPGSGRSTGAGLLQGVSDFPCGSPVFGIPGLPPSSSNASLLF